MKKNAVIIGATGEVGSLLLQELLQSSKINIVTAITRRKLNVKNDKLNEIILDFNNFKKEIPNYVKNNQLAFRYQLFN